MQETPIWTRLGAVAVIALGLVAAAIPTNVAADGPGTAPSGEYLKLDTWDVYWYDQATDSLSYLRHHNAGVGASGETVTGQCGYIGNPQTTGVYSDLGACAVAASNNLATGQVNLVKRYDMRTVLGVGVTRTYWIRWDTCFTADRVCDTEQTLSGAGVPCVATTVSACGQHSPTDARDPVSGKFLCIRVQLKELDPITSVTSTLRETGWTCNG